MFWTWASRYALRTWRATSFDCLGVNEETVRIEYTGLRPGEKLFEEVIDADERLIETPHPKLQIAEARPVPAQQVVAVMHEIAQAGAVSDEVAREVLVRWVPEFAQFDLSQRASSPRTARSSRSSPLTQGLA